MSVPLKIRRVLSICAFSLVTLAMINAQTVRIMPLGNSITFDENSLDKYNPRSDGDRIAYRYRLYQLLHDAGYDFDFVGSKNSGYNYFQDADLDDNAGVPGIMTYQLADMISTGYNAIGGYYETPGPYLNYHPADIILLHIGTNALIESAAQVQELLNRIRLYDSDVFILVARIINRRTYHPSTTTFNNNVELMVTMRGDPRIRMVNLETGAGINYSADMIDNLHPNQVGYNKMAYKWFEAINTLNQAPVISAIPEQFSTQGNAFAPLLLDPYVNDNEDPVESLSWTFTRKLGSQLNVFIDSDRKLHVSPNGGWYGSEELTLEVTDSGSGAFPRTSIKRVTFTVNKGNDAPIINSSPLTEIFQNDNYSYSVEAIDVDGDSIYYSVIQKPSWLTFQPVTHVLNGIPENDDVGIHDITLRVSDGEDFSDQNFELEVFNVNDPPDFTSTPVREVDQGEQYSYIVSANDPDGDPIIFSAVLLPSWLQFDPDTRLLAGEPGYIQVGVHEVVLQATDGTEPSRQSFQVEVINTNDPPEFLSAAVTEVKEDADYYYNVMAQDIDGDDLTFTAPQIPDWASFDPNNRVLSGTPLNEDVGDHNIVIRVSDGYVEVDQEFILTVINVNDPPYFITDPVTSVKPLDAYIYKVVAEDIDPGDVLTYSTVQIPDWMVLAAGSEDALLYGNPTFEHLGSHAVIIQVSDGKVARLQGFTLKVSNTTGVDDFSGSAALRVYPNPSDEVVYFGFEKPGKFTLQIFNSTGTLQKFITSENEEEFEVNISDLKRGIYMYKVVIDGREETGKLIKN